MYRKRIEINRDKQTLIQNPEVWAEVLKSVVMRLRFEVKVIGYPVGFSAPAHPCFLILARSCNLLFFRCLFVISWTTFS